MVRDFAKILMLLASFASAAGPVAHTTATEGLKPMEIAGSALEKLLHSEHITGLDITEHLANAVVALDSDPSAEAAKLKANLGILVSHLGTLQGRELHHIQNLYYREFYRGLIFSSNIPSVQQVSVTGYKKPLATWLANVLVDVYFKLFAAEINLHFAVNDAEQSRYFGSSFFNLRSLDCAKEASSLPPVLGSRLRPFCETYRRELETVGFAPRNDFAAVAKKADFVLKFAVGKSNELRNVVRTSAASKNYLDKQSMMSSDAYAKPLVQMKSCLATFFTGSGALNPLLREVYKDYHDVHGVSYPDRLLPFRSPTDQRIFDVRNLMKITAADAEGVKAIQLMSFKQKLIQQSKEHRKLIVENLKQLDEKVKYLEELERDLPAAQASGDAMKTELLTNMINREHHRFDEFAVRIIAQYPQAAGLFWPRMSDGDRMDTYWMLLEASKYYEEQPHAFANKTTLITLLLIGTLFVPGGWVVNIAGHGVRVGTAFYLSLLATQGVVTAQYLDSLWDLQKRARGEQIFPHEDPFLHVKSEEIERGLKVGYLSLALVVLGEALGYMHIGEGVISHAANRIVGFFRHIMAKRSASHAGLQLSTMQGVTGAFQERFRKLGLQVPQSLRVATSSFSNGPGFNHFVRVVKSLERPGTMLVPASRAEHLKAYQLVKAIEKDADYQSRIAQSLMLMSSERTRVMYLEAAIQVTVRDSILAGGMNATLPAFKTMVTRSLDKLLQAFQSTGKFNLNMMAVTPQFRRDFVRHMPQINKAVAEFASGAAVAPSKYGPMLAGLFKKVVRLKYDEAAEITRGAGVIGLGQATVVRALAEAAVREANPVLERLALDPRIQELFFQRAPWGALMGRVEIHHEFFLDKAIRVVEAAEHNLGAVAAAAGRAVESHEAAAERVLIDANSFPLTTPEELIAVNQSITALLLKNSPDIDKASREFFNPENVRDCSIF